MKTKYLAAVICSLGLALASADMSFAKDKGGKPKNKGNNVKVDKPGNGAKKVPPGQVKRYTRGAKLPSDLNYKGIDDLSKWKLKPPGNGNRYIQVDGDVLEVTDDLSSVVTVMGAVGDLLN